MAHLCDPYRAQLYLRQVQELLERSPVREYLSDQWIQSLCAELDQLFIPVCVHEVQRAKEEGTLKGASSISRYENFFHQGGIGRINENYPLLFEIAATLVDASSTCADLCVRRFHQDRDEIAAFLGVDRVALKSISPAGMGDRHRGSQALVIELVGGSRLLYKCVDLTPDWLYGRFLDFFDRSYPFDGRLMGVLRRGEYGWIEYIHHDPCSSLKEVERYYVRAGALLALGEALNYSDGHAENLIASGASPVLLDGETLFQNYPPDDLENKNVLATMLLQKTVGEVEERVSYSGLQGKVGPRMASYFTHVENDGTDELSVHYHCRRSDGTFNQPLLDGTAQPVELWVESVAQGYLMAYDRITQVREMDDQWWKDLAHATVRAVMRPTAAYVYLLRRIHHPDLICDREKTMAFLMDKLEVAPFGRYEAEDLLRHNIPYFSMQVDQRHLVDGDGEVYENFFVLSNLEGVRYSLSHRSEQARDWSAKIIRRHLAQPMQEAVGG